MESNWQLFSGEMSELAEGARLEIACTANSGTEGSNPSLSAINSTPEPAALPREDARGLVVGDLKTELRFQASP